MRINKVYIPVLWILIVSGNLACEKKETTKQATADAFIKSLIYQGDTLYALAHSVFSFDGIDEVTVRYPSGDSMLLPGRVDDGISVFKEPSVDLGDYSSIRPAPGVYSYRITFNDNERVVVPNTLGSNYLLPAVIDSFNLSQDGQSVVLKWNPVTDAQLYQVRIYKGDTDVMPATRFASNGPLRVVIPVSSFSTAIPGTFIVELDAVLFESAAGRQLQALSLTLDSVNIQ